MVVSNKFNKELLIRSFEPFLLGAERCKGTGFFVPEEPHIGSVELLATTK